MRNRLIHSAAALALAGVLLSDAQGGDYWAKGGNNPDGTSATVAVEIDSIVDADGLRSAWVFLLIGAATGEISSITGMRYSFRCRAQEQALRQFVEYDPTTLSPHTQQVVSKIEFSSPFPGTVPSTTMAFICKFRAADRSKDEDTDLGFARSGATLQELRAWALAYFRWRASQAN